MSDQSQYLWGIDLGGTKVEGVVLKSAQQPEVLFRDRISTEAEKGYEHILGQIKKVVEQIQTKAGCKPTQIGIATPGTLDPLLGTMKNCNSTSLNGKPLKSDLEKLLGVKIKMANDADCFALAEANMGVVKDRLPNAKVVFGVILGTGVGGGIVVEGRAISGLQGIAGEWGHNFLDETGGPCYCGKSGCVEKILSGPNLEKYYESLTGNRKSLKDIFISSTNKHDEAAVKTMKRLTDFFGKALSVVVNILDPDIIVIGGGVGNIDLIYSEGVESLRKHVFNNRLDTPVVKPKLGDSAGVFGAAYLVA